VRGRIAAAVALAVVAATQVPVALADDGGRCGRSSHLCAEQAVRTYLASLTDPSQIAEIPLADDVVRHENGLDTGHSAAAVRQNLAAEHLLVARVADVTLFLSGSSPVDVFVRYLVLTKDTHPATVHVMERFRYDDGRITEIDAVLCIAVGGYEGSRNAPPAEVPGNQGTAGIAGGAICTRSLGAVGTAT
jgi:hypothetical protein